MDTVALASAKSHLISRLRWWSDRYAADLAFVTPEQLAECPMGKARTILEFSAEVAGLNLMTVGLIKSGAIEMPTDEQRAGLAASVHDLESAQAVVKSSTAALIEALETADEAALATPAPNPFFGQMAPFDLASIAMEHISYHCGQLNYIQTLHGDTVNHWFN